MDDYDNEDKHDNEDNADNDDDDNDDNDMTLLTINGDIGEVVLDDDVAREQERVMVDINHGPGGSCSDVLLVSKLAKNFKR